LHFRRGARAILMSAALLACAAAAGAEETVLVFERLTRTTAMRPSSAGGPVLIDTTRADLLVALGDHRLVVYEPAESWIYDFAGKHVKRVSARTSTYSEWSLHAFVAFKEMELEDRLAERRSIQAAHPGGAPSVLELESLFSIPARARSAGRRESLVDSSNADRVHVWINGLEAVQAAPSDQRYGPGRGAMFDRFLAFHEHLHPKARADVRALGRIPSRILYRYRDVNQVTVVLLQLRHVGSAPDENDPAAASTRADLDDPSYQELERRLIACRSCGTSGDWADESRRFEAAALDSGRFLDAALARAERVLGGCERDATWPAALEQRAVADSAVGACRAGLAWRDSVGAARALQRLERVAGTGLAKGYVLDYLRGRARIGAHDPSAGASLMVGAIGGNPCMAGAWLDLASAYLQSYQPVLAWMCLEAAERVGPSGCQVRLAERATRERELERRYPDLFE
jgi:hypothetical protein